MAPTRLERMMHRLTAQAAWLDHAVGLLERRPGVVLEIGLGKGRTFDHLRHRLPERTIYAFDHDCHAPAAARPAPERLVLGDFRATLPRTVRALALPVALAHADFGSEDPAHDAGQAAWLGPLLADLLPKGAILIADRPLDVPAWQPLDPPRPLVWSYYGWQI